MAELFNELDELSNGLVVDTGPMLMHVFHKLRNGRYLNKVLPADIPKPDATKVCQVFERLIGSAKRVVITPSTLVELHALVQRSGKRVGIDITEFLGVYAEVIEKVEERYVPKDLILRQKQSWKFCFADTSLMLAARDLNLPLLTTERGLRDFCASQRIQSYHLYYDVFLKFP